MSLYASGMPVFEYEHLDGECELGEHRFAILHSAGEAELRFCPWCGKDVRRVVSPIHVRARSGFSAAKAAKHGLTTWKRARKGEWEKVDGPGVDGIISSEEDRAALEAETQAEPDR